jgi:glucose-6-phosphate dehydrogenase assembly protein OpcA
MADLINALPGVELPVGEMTSRLASMWEAGPSSTQLEFRASQMNVVLHFGLDVTPEQARERFAALIRFAQRYPSRIIVLCPTRTSVDGAMESKLFSQCYIGESHREMCCCEALLLSYQSEDFGHLANQVSIWLEGDLPTYHWFSGVPGARIQKYFDNLLLSVRRCIYDSSVEAEDLAQLNWPDPDRVSDLALARLLPVRQAIGQYLSGYPIDCLCDGLQSVTVTHCASMSGEGARLLEWVRACLQDCDLRQGCSLGTVEFQAMQCDGSGEAPSLALELAYQDERYFKWRKSPNGSLGEIEADLGKTEEVIPTRVKPLAFEQALAEAFFF